MGAFSCLRRPPSRTTNNDSAQKGQSVFPFHDESKIYPPILPVYGKGNREETGKFPGDGEAYTVAGLFAVMGFIVPVEPFEKPFIVHVFAVFVIVGDGKSDFLLLASYGGNGDGPFVVTILDAVIEKDMKDF